MADADNVNSVDTPNENSAANAEPVADLGKELQELKDKLAKTEEILAKARKGEKDNQTRRKDLEAELAQIKAAEDGEDFKSKYEAVSNELGQMKETAKNQLIDNALKEELEKANAKSISTVLKIVDRSKVNVVDGKVDTKSVAALIEEIKKTDGVLFDVPKTPEVKRPGEGTPTSGFTTEMKAATSQAEIQRVLAKYGMGSTI